MEEKTQVELLLVHLRDFLKESFNLLVLNTYEKVSRIISGITSVLLIGTLLGFILLFISIGLALWIGRLMNESFVGFFIVGGIYLLMALIFYSNRSRWIQTSIIDVMLKN